jgi:hypothetical protein
VLERRQVGVERGDVVEATVEPLPLPDGEPAVVDAHEVVRRARHKAGERAVGAHHGSARGERGHADLRPVEELPELLEVFADDRLLLGRPGSVGPRPDRSQRGPAPRLGQDLEETVGQLLQGDRLLDEVRGAQLASAGGELRLLEAGEHHHPGLRAQGQDRRKGLEPVHLRHRGVQEQQGGLVTEGEQDGLIAVRALADHVEAGRLQEDPDHRADLRRVVDQNDGGPPPNRRVVHVSPVPSFRPTMPVGALRSPDTGPRPWPG